jgi:hypothetical protein
MLWSRWTQNLSRTILLTMLSTSALSCETVQDVLDFIDSISDGAPCTSDAECLGGRCLTAAMGYPNGYCTTLQCSQEGCSGLSSQCFKTQLEGKDLTACYELCNFDSTCDRGTEGYTCVQLQDTPVCMPPGATNAPAQGATGAACSTDLQCNGENGVCLTSFFGGYCTQLGCDGGTECLSGSECVPFDAGEGAVPSTHGCVAPCTDDSDCRFAYSCQNIGDINACLPQERDQAIEPRNPDGDDDGAACVANINCSGGTCIREANSGEDISHPGGYCTTRDCRQDEDCNGNAQCVPRQRSTTCLSTCEGDADCRSGYSCRDIPLEGGETRGVCDSNIEAIVPEVEGSSEIEVSCSSATNIDFTIPEGALGFYISPFTSDGQKIVPTELVLPSGDRINIGRDYSFHAINPDLLGSMAPMLFPATDDSRFRDAFGGGDYSLRTNTEANEICSVILPKLAEGTLLRVNLVLVGVSGLSASTAKTDRDLGQVLEIVRSIYTSMNIDVELTSVSDATDQVTAQYSVMRDFYDVFNLVATSQSPGPSAEESLSVNVFLIEDFQVSEAPGLLGVSTGIPGMAGLHGNSGSGLVFSAVSLGDDNRTLGQTMAHEIGHFLGLRHTTEHLGLEHDPITDTPECLFPDLGFICPDAENFMFAYALGSNQTKTSSGQAFVVRRSPLVQ